MRARMAIVAAAVLCLTAAAKPNEALISGLRKLGTAVDNMVVNISKAESDDAALALTKATQQAFENGLKGEHATIEFKSSHGYCRATFETPAWKMWSEARDGKIVDHGATIH